MKPKIVSLKRLTLSMLGILCAQLLCAQLFTQSNLDFNGFDPVENSTSLMFGPDGKLYTLNIDGLINIYSTIRIDQDEYQVSAAEFLSDVRNIPNHNDDGTSSTENIREATGLTVVGNPSNPVIYVSSSDSRIGGPSGDLDLDTNSGVITRLSWNGSSWDVVDIVRGLPRSEENHATNGLEFATINGNDYLIVCSGGHTNAGAPSDNFAWTTEYALSAAILSINLTQIEGMAIKTQNGRQYIYDIPTLDDPSRSNVHADGSAASSDPSDSNYSPLDLNDPWGGSDGLNQAMIVPGGPVQIFSPGYRNAYDLVLTQGGSLYVTDNGPNGGWGGFPENEGTSNATNQYLPSEPGSTELSGDEIVNNRDHLTKVTDDIQTYLPGSFYGGHPNPVRANPYAAGLYTNPGVNNVSTDARFRTEIYDPSNPQSGYTSNTLEALPANWPPVLIANTVEGDYRGSGDANPDGPLDDYLTTWSTNTNAIDEYTASNFGGAMQGDLIAGKNGGKLFRVQLDGFGNLSSLDENFQTNLGGNPLGLTCNGDNDPHPGTIWAATFNSNIKIFEPADAIVCFLPGNANYSANDDNDADGYSNQDEIDNKGIQLDENVICNPGNQPEDFDKDAGGNLVSNLNDDDDDNDGILDQNDAFQLGDFFQSGTDAFFLPVVNELFSDNSTLKGYLGLGFTGMMNNGSSGANWLDWIDVPGDGPNPNDLLGGAVGAMTMQMGEGTALGSANSQRKAFQYGVNVDQSTGGFTVKGRLFNFTADLQLYGASAPADGELGIFLGDGTQSNYIKIVLRPQGIRFQQEINDNPQSPIDIDIPIANRPQDPNDNVVFIFSIDPTLGTVTGLYSFDQGASFQTIGTIITEGTILNALQSSTPLAVGLIGSSNTSGVEVEGSWDYLIVEGSQPTIQENFPEINVAIDAPDDVFDLGQYFNDNDGDSNLTYSVQNNSNPAIGAIINGGNLTLSYPATIESSSLILRATDQNGLFIQQNFQVNVSDLIDPTPIKRIRVAGAEVTASDAPNPNWEGINVDGSFAGPDYSVNTGNISVQNLTNRHSSVTAYVPSEIGTSNRWDPSSGEEMEFDFDLPNADYIVRLYFGNGNSALSQVGNRYFDVKMEGILQLDNFDPIASFGHDTLGMVERAVTVSDEELNVLFEHEVSNPNIFAIEILGYPISVQPLADRTDDVGAIVNIPLYASGGNTGTYTYSASGLPDGIQIEPTTGLLFGTLSSSAAASTPYNPEITVSKNGSIPASTKFFWTVNSQTWTDQTDNENYTARHECSFVQAGDKFYLFGGRENPTTLDVYDFGSKSWTQISNSAPKDFNHFQATEYKGLIWVIGAFKDNGFPNEEPEENIWAYNPALDAWIQGPSIPIARRRGSAGLAMYNDKFYIVGGNTIGHNGGYVSWFDEFDPETGIWTDLGSAPRTRDHFHAQTIGDKLYVAGGRRSGGSEGVFEPLVAEVDVYDFTTSTWTQVTDIPTPRAAAAVAEMDGKLFVIGGEIRNDLEGQAIFDAMSTTESFDPISGNWNTEDDLISKRHGTQAIKSGDGIHVAAGSPKLGGGRIKEMEFLGDDNPVGSPSLACSLNVPSSAEILVGSQKTITISASNGNVGILITSLALSGNNAGQFSIVSDSGFSLLSPGSSKNVIVEHLGSSSSNTATLTITYDDGSTATVALSTTNTVADLDFHVELQGLTDYSESYEVTLCDAASNQSILSGTYTATASGDFSITDIPLGNYDIYVDAPGYLRKGKTNVSLTAGSNTFSLIKSAGSELRAGDSNNSNAVNSSDLAELQAGFYSFGTSIDTDLDFDASGGITIVDYSILASNYGQSGESVCSGGESADNDNSISTVGIKTLPETISLAEGEVSSFYVVLDNPNGVPVNGIDLRMIYEPDDVEILEYSDAYGWDHILWTDDLTSRFHISGGSLSNGPTGNDQLFKVKIRAKATLGASSISFDRSPAMLTEVASKGFAVLDQTTPLSLNLLGPCVGTRIIDHTPLIDGEFQASQVIRVMSGINVLNSAIMDAPLVEIPGDLTLPNNALLTIKKDGCN